MAEEIVKEEVEEIEVVKKKEIEEKKYTEQQLLSLMQKADTIAKEEAKKEEQKKLKAIEDDKKSEIEKLQDENKEIKNELEKTKEFMDYLKLKETNKDDEDFSTTLKLAKALVDENTSLEEALQKVNALIKPKEVEIKGKTLEQEADLPKGFVNPFLDDDIKAQNELYKNKPELAKKLMAEADKIALK